MIRISALLMALLFSSCSYVTVIRTQELKNVETNVTMKIDSLEFTIDSLMKEQRRVQNRTSADIRLILSSMAKNNEGIKARLEETQFRLDKINEKSDSILTKKPEVIEKEVQVVTVTDTAQLVNDQLLLKTYEESRESFNTKDYKKAFVGFKKVYEGHSDKNMAEKALFWLAACYEESGKFEGAVKNYKRLFEGFPTGKKVCTAKLKLAHLAKKLKDDSLKMETLKSLINDSHCSGSSAVMQAEEMLQDN